MVGELAGVAVHGLADIVGGIAVVVGAQIGGIAELGEHVFGARLPAGVGDAVAELGVEHEEIGSAQQHAGVGIGAARCRVGRVVAARTSGKSGQERRRVRQLGGNG